MRSRISIRGCVRPSVRPSVGHTRVEFLRNGTNLNKIASGTWNYAIKKTIQGRVSKQFARMHLMSDVCDCQTCSLKFRFVSLGVIFAFNMGCYLELKLSSLFLSRLTFRMVDNCVTGDEVHQKRSNFAIVDYSCIPAFSVCGQDQVITHMYR